MFFFDYYSLSLFLGGVIALGSGLLVFLRTNRQLEHVAWLLLSISTAIWSFGYYSMIIASDKSSALISNIVLHIGASFIPLFYFLFIIAIAEKFHKYKKAFIILVPVAIIFAAITPLKSFVTDVYQKGPFTFAPNAGPLYWYFTIYFFAIVIASVCILYLKIRESRGDDVPRLKFIFWSSLAGFIGGSSVFLLTFNVLIPPFPVLLFTFYPLIIAYAILKYHLFDVRVITAQLLTATLWIILLFRTVLANTKEESIISAVILILVIIFGVWLVSNVGKEIRQRERIQKLASDLEKANVHLTELNRQKSEFVSFATHQLRAPLTAMKGYSSLLLEGDMGKLPEQAKKGIDNIFESAKTLTNIVDDYLNVSRIELGTMKYAFETVDFKQLVDSVISELKPNIEKSKLAFSFKTEESEIGYRITADRDKLKQVIANLIDNSMKYTPSGKVEVSLAYDKMGHKYIFKIKDTGVGIAPEVQSHLFQKFTRASNANKVNIRGTGLGLYVAKQIVEAHHGNIKVESPGEGKGSTFTVEIEPMMRG